MNAGHLINHQVWTWLLFCVLALSVAQDDLDDEDIPIIEGRGPDVTILEEGDVLVLTSETFHHVVATRSPILVEFYAPWCGHCKTLAPEYAKAAQLLKPEGIRIAKVDTTMEEELAKEFEVTSFPTLKLFVGGKPVEEYSGARTAQAFVDYMKQKSDPNYKPPPTAVLELTTDNFEEAVTPSALILVEFYAPWCKHCKQLAPEYESAAAELKGNGIPLAKVDATTNKELAEQYGVSGYPSLKVFRYGRPFEFKGGRDSAGIASYMRLQQKLPSEEVRSLANAKNAVKRTQPTVFACFSSKETDLYTEYIAAANELRGELPLVHTFDTKLGAKYKVPKDSISILMPEIYQSKYEDAIRTMEQSEGPASASAIVSFMRERSVPLLGERTMENDQLFYSARPLLVVYGNVDFSHQHVDATQHLRRKLLPLASRYREDLTFALSNEEQFSQEMESVGLGDSGEDVNAAIFSEKQKFSMEPDDDYVEAIEEFVSKFKKGKLKAFMKSQPVPARQTGPVKVLVAKNYDKEVTHNNKKDFLIEFYAPWCGHCKSLEPIYKQLAKQLSSTQPDVVVAKFDATANDLPAQFDMKGFPAIFYVKADDKFNPIKFEGDRSLDKLKEFVNEQRAPTAVKDEL